VPKLYNSFFCGLSLKFPKVPKRGMLGPFLGGKVRIMLTASAPISAEVKDYMSFAIGAPICEAYG